MMRKPAPTNPQFLATLAAASIKHPMDIDEITRRALRAIAPLTQAELDAATYRELFMSAKRTDAGRTLPPYYLVYFLLVDLLGFRNNGQWEKTAWSVTVDFEGTPFLIDHRKFGLGIFGLESPESEAIATRVATCLHRAVKAAQPYFDWRAEIASSGSQLNVVNRSRELFEHLEFYLELYADRAAEAEDRRDEVIKTKTGPNSWMMHCPAHGLGREARRYASAAIEGFCGWTELVCIHVAIRRGRHSTGKEVGALASADWADKYKAALDVTNAADK